MSVHYTQSIENSTSSRQLPCHFQAIPGLNRNSIGTALAMWGRGEAQHVSVLLVLNPTNMGLQAPEARYNG